MSTGRDVRIAIPGWADSIARMAEQGAALRLPAAEWVMARGGKRANDAPGWREWLLRGAGMGDDVMTRFPAGPCSVGADSIGDVAQTWARAEPVHLLTAIDHLQLAAPVPLPLERSESGPLLESLNAHLAGTGFELRGLADGGWLCRGPEGLECETVEPWEALGQNLRDVLPSGRDAVRVRSLVNDLQMLLHEHPVNERRVARGLPAVNSVWLWGFGVARDPVATVSGELLADDAWLAGLWRRHRGEPGSLPALAEVLAAGDAHVRVASLAGLDGRDVAEALRALETDVFQPVRTALLESRVGRVSLHTGRHLVDLTPSSRWAFWRRPRPLAAASS